ncbi:MAG: peptidoglycan-associated lipoprotein Pal [Proteobacteria bacterium]|nr:peptidoglycan-associated lipoprotein Pal [Pseudomonadota bacterium]
MRWKILVIFLGGLSLAACETTPGDTGSSTGAAGGGTMNSTGSGQSKITSNSLASRPESTGPRRGSQEDLVTNVGDRIFFDFDSIQLGPDARAILEKQSSWLKQNPDVVVWVEGHADERGTREYNLALGERRANAMRDYMLALGISQGRMKTRSFGKERPVDPSSNKDAWDKNRRGVLVIQ